MAKNLLQGRIKLAEFVRNVHGATPEAGITLEDMQRPEYWAHVAKTLRAGDRIEVLPEDKSWFAELFVRSQNDNTVHVAVLKHVVFDKPAAKSVGKPDNAEPYKVEHKGSMGWSVIRKSDKAVVFQGGQSRKDAEAWVEAEAEIA